MILKVNFIQNMLYISFIQAAPLGGRQYDSLKVLVNSLVCPAAAATASASALAFKLDLGS